MFLHEYACQCMRRGSHEARFHLGEPKLIADLAYKFSQEERTVIPSQAGREEVFIREWAVTVTVDTRLECHYAECREAAKRLEGLATKVPVVGLQAGTSPDASCICAYWVTAKRIKTSATRPSRSRR